MKKIEAAEIELEFPWLADTSGLEKFPAIQSFLCDRDYEGTGPGRERQAGTIYIAVKDGCLQVTLKEPTQKMQARVVVPNFNMLLPTIESILTGPSSVWERDPWARSLPTKKRK